LRQCTFVLFTDELGYDYYDYNFAQDYSPSPPHASGGPYRPTADASPQVPDYKTWKANWDEKHRDPADKEQAKWEYSSSIGSMDIQ
jgi:hypothetical protein